MVTGRRKVQWGVLPLSAPKRARWNIMTPQLAAALDRTQISSRDVTYIVNEAAASLGHDVTDLNINRNSIHRYMDRHRLAHSKGLKEEFSTNVPFIILWDGKLMEDLPSQNLVDRLPVLVSSLGVEQLLSVPKLPTGIGEAQAFAVVKCLEDWKIADCVQALCFNTTASNISQLVIGAAFETTIGGSSAGPEILMYKIFRGQWQYIEHHNFKPA